MKQSTFKLNPLYQRKYALSIRKLYGHHHNLVDRYEIYIGFTDDYGYVPYVVNIIP